MKWLAYLKQLFSPKPLHDFPQGSADPELTPLERHILESVPPEMAEATLRTFHRLQKIGLDDPRRRYTILGVTSTLMLLGMLPDSDRWLILFRLNEHPARYEFYSMILEFLLDGPDVPMEQHLENVHNFAHRTHAFLKRSFPNDPQAPDSPSESTGDSGPDGPQQSA